MSPLLVSILLLATPPDDIAGPPDLAPPIPRLRRAVEITKDIDELVRRESRATSDADRASIAYDMSQLYLELKRDPRLAISDSLQEAKSRLSTRLTRIKKDVQAKLKREGRTDTSLTDEEVLAMADIEFVTQSLTDHFALTGSMLGGPATVLSQSSTSPVAQRPDARGGGTAFDYGPELVELIQRTLVPEFWDVNGGPGAIVYYRPLMCLVVRATSDVHHRLGGTFGALRSTR